jgi:nitrite reductase (NADH) large subunit
MLVGNTGAAARLVQIFDRGDPLPEDPLEVLCPRATFGADARGDRIVCNCNKVSEARLREAIGGGAVTLEALGQATKAGTGCGSCRTELTQLLAAQPQPAPVPIEPKVASAN